MALDPTTDELKHFKKIISKMILFKKIAIMHGKGEFSKTKGGICSIPIEAANIYIFYQRQQFPIVVNLKQDLKYWGHVDFEPVRPHIIYQALA